MVSNLYKKDEQGNFTPYIPENKDYYIGVLGQCISNFEEIVLQIKMIKQARLEKDENFDDDEISYMHELVDLVSKIDSVLQSYTDKHIK